MSEKKHMTIAFPSGGIVPAEQLKAKADTNKTVAPHEPVEVLTDYGQSLIADRFAYAHDGKTRAPAKPSSAADAKAEAKRIVDAAKAEAKRIVDRAKLEADVTAATALVDIAPDAKKAEAQKALDDANAAMAAFEKPVDEQK